MVVIPPKDEIVWKEGSAEEPLEAKTAPVVAEGPTELGALEAPPRSTLWLVRVWIPNCPVELLMVTSSGFEAVTPTIPAMKHSFC